MSDSVKAAWIGAGATVVATGITAIAGLYLGLWAPKAALESPKVSIASTGFDGESKSGEKASSKDIEKPENSLGKIFIGMGRSYANSLFGVPVVEVSHEFDNTLELNYMFKKFYLQLIFSKSGSLTFYSVVSRDMNFTPCIPKLEKCIGENTFSQMAEIEGFSGKYSHTYLYSYLTSKHYGYGEYLYLGNAGDYHNYYLGYNSLGADFSSIFPFTKFGKSDSEWELFRVKHKPNSFGVGDMSSIDDNNLHYEIGPEYYTFRNR
ncbi:ETEC_3214 domain-containing protein [Teredinibacter sp. KSP-S5-2]|uniref:ETEC_3214 domain-containing protein n=1 Tax=Teredinibacter sp. KSP-S5-2 TaxID=3034506 RepID=UPI0029347130|nr:ETEC_3214 domain-containing protein [Teredinibacter sp. KSP-S5-2]WNO10583.1 hypothetical protein P5V12_05290 [Teredinibacter sp. KSP-S5-2]